MQAPAEPATGEMIFPGPPFPPKVPQNGGGQSFPPLPQKMPILFHSGNKGQFKLCPKSVSNYQNQLVEAEKLRGGGSFYKLTWDKGISGLVLASWKIKADNPQLSFVRWPIHGAVCKFVVLYICWLWWSEAHWGCVWAGWLLGNLGSRAACGIKKKKEKNLSNVFSP